MSLLRNFLSIPKSTKIKEALKHVADVIVCNSKGKGGVMVRLHRDKWEMWNKGVFFVCLFVCFVWFGLFILRCGLSSCRSGIRAEASDGR